MIVTAEMKSKVTNIIAKSEGVTVVAIRDKSGYSEVLTRHIVWNLLDDGVLVRNRIRKGSKAAAYCHMVR
jgi:ribosomal protein S25